MCIHNRPDLSDNYRCEFGAEEPTDLEAAGDLSVSITASCFSISLIMVQLSWCNKVDVRYCQSEFTNIKINALAVAQEMCDSLASRYDRVGADAGAYRAVLCCRITMCVSIAAIASNLSQLQALL
jgi:hypothetical protein